MPLLTLASESKVPALAGGAEKVRSSSTIGFPPGTFKRSGVSSRKRDQEELVLLLLKKHTSD
jgi:hypothetical protein